MSNKHQTTSFDMEIKESNDEKREITAIGSKQLSDRDNDIISVDGMDIKNFRKNNVFLWAHRGSETPENVLGNATKVWKDGKKLMFKLKFLDMDVNPRADLVYKMYKAKVLKAFSIGFSPDWSVAKYEEKRGGFDFPKSELLEISAVPVPANPAALVQTAEFKSMIDNGDIDELEAKDFEIFLKENYKEINIPIPVEKKVILLEKKVSELEKRFETPPEVKVDDVIPIEDIPVEDLDVVDQALGELFEATDDKSTVAPKEGVEDDDLNSIFTELENG